MTWFLAFVTLLAWSVVMLADWRRRRTGGLAAPSPPCEAPDALRRSLARRVRMLTAACDDALAGGAGCDEADTALELAQRMVPQWNRSVDTWRDDAGALQLAVPCLPLSAGPSSPRILRALVSIERCLRPLAAGEPGRLELHLRLLRAALALVERRLARLARVPRDAQRRALPALQADIDRLARDLAASYEALHASWRRTRAVTRSHDLAPTTASTH